ncbi:unnamed protein product [Hydatigera taeniaeformis]|uniref:Transmembrane protein n=1 Tax=Hydatigena taeniaeformis TaxID=6205 RepID=A0A0R3X8P1_HYDTA|nr:unnamed protein product [Hydatigera taeniaeformis]
MHMNVTVIIPERRHSVPEGRNIALADSANIAQEDTFHIPSPKPILTDFGMSVNPRSSRFIGLLVAYILITLLVVYMVVCAVCFQPRKCLSLVGRDADGEGESFSSPTPPPPSARTSRSRRFTWRWLQPRVSTNQTASVPLVLPRTNPHFSRSVNGERFLHYPVHFRIAPNLPSTAVESPTENWNTSNPSHHPHHQPQRHQQTGRISLAKARCNSLCGSAKISHISYNSAEMASHGATARIRVYDSSVFDLIDELSPFDNYVGSADAVKASTDCKVPDPINWFCGVLVPPQLRLAQVSFRRSLRLVAELATRRAALLQSAKQLSDLIGARDRLDNESLVPLIPAPTPFSQTTP